MKELDNSQINLVTGGHVVGFIIGYAAGKALDYVIEANVNYWTQAVNDGWGQNATLPPPNSGFSTL